MVRPFAVLIGLGAVSGCGRSYGPCEGFNESAEGVVDTSGDVPVFDWEFGTAYALSVYEKTGDEEYGELMWHVQCGGDNLEDDESLEAQVCISTPIAYGEEVDSPFLDTVNTDRAKPLKSGTTYVVLLNTMVEDDGPTVESSYPDWLDWQSDRDDPKCGSGFSAEVEFVATGPGVPHG